jgi:uncharacterized protein (DUF433 family)
MTLLIETKPVPLRAGEDGVILVGATRVPLDTVVYAFQSGNTAEEIVEQYDALRLSDVYAVIAYYLDHQDAVDAYVKQREAQATMMRQENERRFPRHGLRQKLLARLERDA